MEYISMESNWDLGKAQSNYHFEWSLPSQETDFKKVIRYKKSGKTLYIEHSTYNIYLLPHIHFINSGFDIEVAKVDRFKIINFYHPSYRVPRSMSYSLLGMICVLEIPATRHK